MLPAHPHGVGQLGATGGNGQPGDGFVVLSQQRRFARPLGGECIDRAPRPSLGIGPAGRGEEQLASIRRPCRIAIVVLACAHRPRTMRPIDGCEPNPAPIAVGLFVDPMDDVGNLGAVR